MLIQKYYHEVLLNKLALLKGRLEVKIYCAETKKLPHEEVTFENFLAKIYLRLNFSI